ncbi:MAG: hypothetical protein K6G65_07680, partial [Lachnospiraceae bacterium]|nr:hypothetical protein [Lachnospiraceae bacterium]
MTKHRTKRERTLFKKACSLFMTLLMVVTLLPTYQAPAASAETASNDYITDSNGIMSYQYIGEDTNARIDIQGNYNGEWKQVTFSNAGFEAVVNRYMNGDTSVENNWVRVNAGPTFSDVANIGLQTKCDVDFLYG